MKFTIVLLITLISASLCQSQVEMPKFLAQQTSNTTEISQDFLTKVTTLLNQKMQIQLNTYETQVTELSSKLTETQNQIVQSENHITELRSELLQFQQAVQFPLQPRNAEVNDTPAVNATTPVTTEAKSETETTAQTQDATPVAATQEAAPALATDAVAQTPVVEAHQEEVKSPEIQAKTEVVQDLAIPQDKNGVDSYNNGQQDVVQDFQSLDADKYTTLANQTTSDGSIEIAYSIPIQKFTSDSAEIIAPKGANPDIRGPITSPQQRMYLSQQRLEQGQKQAQKPVQKQAASPRQVMNKQVRQVPRQQVQQQAPQQQFQNQQFQIQQQYQQQNMMQNNNMYYPEQDFAIQNQQQYIPQQQEAVFQNAGFEGQQQSNNEPNYEQMYNQQMFENQQFMDSLDSEEQAMEV